MSLIQIDKKICTECGICRKRCPACFTLVDNNVAVRDNGQRCIECGHCVALCPSDAIVHESFRKEMLSSAPNLANMSDASFFDLVRYRRSHRHFQERPVPVPILNKIIESCRYSPTGVNAREVAIRIIRNPIRIRDVAGLAVDHFVSTFQALEVERSRHEAEGRPMPAALRQQLERNGRYRNMGKSFEKGWDPIFHKAPCVMIFHAPADAPTPRDDCVIAAHTAVLHAPLLGLGTCYIGLFTRAAKERPAILEQLGLPSDNRIFSTLILGYPELLFRKVPYRNPVDVTWE